MIAGDAAHQTPPFMGQGMCSGIRDVANIGWKLNSVIRGGAPCSLLDTYQSEREPHVRAFIGLTVEMGKLINRTVSELLSGSVTNPDDGPQKLTQLRPNLGPGLSAGRMDLTGCLFPQPRLENELLLDEKIGLNSAILIHKDLLYQLSEDLRNRITHSNLVVITEFTTDLADWFDKEKVGAVLIRPDRYILGTATSSDDVQSLVESAFYQLGVV